MQNRNFTCCFTGHRIIAAEHRRQLPEVVEAAIRALIAQGYFIFVAGGATGFDALASETVLALKEEFFQLRLVIVAPSADQTNGWNAKDRRQYERIRQAADEYICLEAAYTPDCMRRRNRFLVEMSAACLAYCVRERSGSAQTLGFAKEQGLEIINVLSLMGKASLNKH